MGFGLCLGFLLCFVLFFNFENDQTLEQFAQESPPLKIFKT